MKVFPDYTPPPRGNVSTTPVDTSVRHAASPPVKSNATHANRSTTPVDTSTRASGGLTNEADVREQIEKTTGHVTTELKWRHKNPLTR